MKSPARITRLRRIRLDVGAGLRFFWWALLTALFLR